MTPLRGRRTGRVIYSPREREEFLSRVRGRIAEAVAAATEPAEPNDHAGNDWPVQLIQDILDLRRHGWGRPTILKELKGETYFNGLGATDYLVGRVLALAKHDDDAPRRLEMALEIACRSPSTASTARATVSLKTLENAVIAANSE